MGLNNESEEVLTYSRHIFLFPFTYDKERSENQNELWIKYDTQSLSQDANYYGASQYFYEPVNQLLGIGLNEPSDYSFEHYRFKMSKGSYTITANKVVYELQLDADGIQLLHSPKMRAGILIFSMKNKTHSDINSVILINQYGRRIYNPFLSEDEKEKGKYSCCETANSIALLAEGDTKLTWKEEFQEKTVLEREYACYISGLLEKFGINKFKHTIDDRMFTMCYISNSWAIICAKEWEAYQNEDQRGELPIGLDAWYRLCFVDREERTCMNNRMISRLLHDATYSRWSGMNTMYGITRYSFIMSIAPTKTESFLEQHFLHHYLYLSSLLLFLRSSLIQLSCETNLLIKKIEKNRHNNEKREEIRNLRIKYLGFINNAWFEEITPQEQGIDLYKIGMMQMELKTQKDSLQATIEELFQFYSSENDHDNNRIITILTMFNMIFLPLGILIQNSHPVVSKCIGGFAFIVYLIFTICLYKWMKWEYKAILIVTAVIYLLLAILGFDTINTFVVTILKT